MVAARVPSKDTLAISPLAGLKRHCEKGGLPCAFGARETVSFDASKGAPTIAGRFPERAGRN